MMDAVFHPAVAAILTDDLDGLSALLDDDPSLVSRRSSCSHPTLLQMVACEAGRLPNAEAAARILVDAGAPLAEPLMAAASVDAREVLRFLLSRGAALDGHGPWRPVDEALYWNHLALAQELLQRGSAMGTLRVAAGLGLLDALDAFFADGALRPEAGPVASPFPDTVPAELASDPQQVLDHALVMAVNNGQRHAAEELLQRGAAVNAAPIGFHWRGTALHAACWRGDVSLVQWLVAQGADPSARDGMEGIGADALGWAQHHGHPDVVAYLESLR
ncbi:MAG: ankyrin repeat domain-containing protein [Myxococcales bacterium]|nr:ankyrin repeat domain-containing protein [Myxococcales bacterium]